MQQREVGGGQGVLTLQLEIGRHGGFGLGRELVLQVVHEGDAARETRARV